MTMNDFEVKALEEKYGKALIKAYGLEWKIMPSVSYYKKDLIHVRNPRYSWTNDYATYSVSSWHYLLFGPITLNDHIASRFEKGHLKLITGLPIEYSSLEELDILLALAGKHGDVSEHA